MRFGFKFELFQSTAKYKNNRCEENVKEITKIVEPF